MASIAVAVRRIVCLDWPRFDRFDAIAYKLNRILANLQQQASRSAGLQYTLVEAMKAIPTEALHGSDRCCCHTCPHRVNASEVNSAIPSLSVRLDAFTSSLRSSPPSTSG